MGRMGVEESAGDWRERLLSKGSERNKWSGDAARVGLTVIWTEGIGRRGHAQARRRAEWHGGVERECTSIRTSDIIAA
jgi:hypothetical protein